MTGRVGRGTAPFRRERWSVRDMRRTITSEACGDSGDGRPDEGTIRSPDAMGCGRNAQPGFVFYLSAYMPLPIEYVPVHVKSSEPSEFSFPVQPPEPLMPLYFPVPLTIFHLLETGLVGSVELDASYV